MAVAAYIFLSVVAFAAGMLLLVRPAWCRLIRYTEKSESRAFQTVLMALTFVIIFVSAWVTEILGVHAIFGAFLFGAFGGSVARGNAIDLTWTHPNQPNPYTTKTTRPGHAPGPPLHAQDLGAHRRLCSTRATSALLHALRWVDRWGVGVYTAIPPARLCTDGLTD